MTEPQIYIRGFPRTTRQDDLKKSFIQYGAIRQVRMLGAYAFVTYENPDDAQVAVKEMNGKDFDNSKLKVQIAGKPKKSKGPQPDDECRFCHKIGHWKNDCSEYKKHGRRRRSYSEDSSQSSSSSSSSRSRSRKHKKSKKTKKSNKNKKRRRSPSSQSSGSSSQSSSSSRSSSSEKKQKDKKKKRISKKSEQGNGEIKNI